MVDRPFRRLRSWPTSSGTCGCPGRTWWWCPCRSCPAGWGSWQGGPRVWGAITGTLNPEILLVHGQRFAAGRPTSNEPLVIGPPCRPPSVLSACVAAQPLEGGALICEWCGCTRRTPLSAPGCAKRCVGRPCGAFGAAPAFPDGAICRCCAHMIILPAKAVYISPSTHTCTHAHTHTRRHAHTQTHTCAPTHICTHTRTCTLARALAHHQVLARPDTFDVAVTTYEMVTSVDFGRPIQTTVVGDPRSW
jgi:hypothetical protein